MKTLVIITHPQFEDSIINKRWLVELKKYPEQFDLHLLYDAYPQLNYEIEVEQKLLAKYEGIIFQFPMHWYSTPFALKKYLDEVFSYGWAFGPGGDKLGGKKVGFAVSAGGRRESYESSSAISVVRLLNDLYLSFEYCGCEITDLHVFYGAMYRVEESDLTLNAQAYVRTFLKLSQV